MAAGEEILWTYGDLSDAELLQTYGFIEDVDSSPGQENINPNASVSVPMSLIQVSLSLCMVRKPSLQGRV